jgi:hypothetical protein
MKEARPAVALLTVGVGEDSALSRDTVDVGRAIPHHPHGVGADLWNADIVAEDDEDIRLAA